MILIFKLVKLFVSQQSSIQMHITLVLEVLLVTKLVRLEKLFFKLLVLVLVMQQGITLAYSMSMMVLKRINLVELLVMVVLI